jgi:hypothetical protein
MRNLLTALAASLAAASSASAHEFTLGDLTVDHPWAPPSIAGQSQGVVYFTVRNAGDAPDRLIGVHADGASSAELHGHVVTGDVMRMTPVEAIDVPADGEAALAPGEFHVMLFGLARPLALDDRLAVTLVFERAGEIEVAAHVESLAAHLTAPGADENHAEH